MHAVDYGTAISFLLQPSGRSRLPVSIPVDHDRLQLLLLYLPWARAAVPGEIQVWRGQLGLAKWLGGSTQG